MGPLAMRLLLPIAFVATVFCLYPETGQELKTLPGETYSALREIAFTKEISISGVDLVSEETVRNSLPLDESVFWWLINSDEVVADLRKDKYISHVEVEPCSDWIVDNWGCFDIRVDERDPKYLVKFNDSYWLLGEEGAFIEPVSYSTQDDRSSLTSKYGELVPVSGLSGESTSPEIVTARFEYVRKALAIIENGLQIGIKDAELTPQGELIVTLRSPEVRARFDYLKDNWPQLKEEISRLRVLLQEVKGTESDIDLIDLAYERLAVVKLNNNIATD